MAFQQKDINRITAQSGYALLDDGSGQRKTARRQSARRRRSTAGSEGANLIRPQQTSGLVIQPNLYRNAEAFFAAITIKSMQEETGSEKYEQSQVIAWARDPGHTEKWPELDSLHGSINGIFLQSDKQRGDAKNAGMTKGVSDLQLLCSRGPFSGLCIELKVGKNGPSAEQKRYLWERHCNRYQCYIAYGRVAAIVCIMEYLSLPNNSLYL